MNDIQLALNDRQKAALRWLAEKPWSHLTKQAILEKTLLSETEVDLLIAYLVRRGGLEAGLVEDRTTFDDVYVLPEIHLLAGELNASEAKRHWRAPIVWLIVTLPVVAVLGKILWDLWHAR